MTWLTQANHPLNIAIFGANGGIAQALTKQLLTLNCENIFCISRKDIKDSDLSDNRIINSTLPTFDNNHLKTWALEHQHIKLDLVIVCTGLLHNATVSPEKRLQDFDPDAFETVFKTNTLIPTLIAKHTLPLMHSRSESAFCALGARVGSISDNNLGGWYSYRASKAALAMMIKTLSIETRRTNPHLRVCALHPGTVDTGLSEPFQRNVKKNALFSPQTSADALIKVIDSLSPEHSGLHLDWNNKVIPA